MNKYLKNLNRIEFVITNACTGRCKHCSEGEYGLKGEHIDGDVAASAVYEVCSLFLSVDAFHQETIPLEVVKYFVECMLSTDVAIRVHPAWLVSETDNNSYNLRTREILKEFTLMGISVSSGNVISPKGNAKKYLGEYFEDGKEYYDPYEEDPEDIKTISFSPNGNVLNGNVYQDDIIKILDTYSID